jgi:hypothetical protein
VTNFANLIFLTNYILSIARFNKKNSIKRLIEWGRILGMTVVAIVFLFAKRPIAKTTNF